MLSAGDHALALDPLDIHASVHTGQERISACSLPVPSCRRISGQVHHRPERNIDTLAPELCAHGCALRQHEVLVPGHAAVHSRWEDGSVVRVTHTDGGIFKAETVEIEARDGTGIADAAAVGVYTGGEVDFFINREAGNKGSGFCNGTRPTTISVDGLCEGC